MKTAIDRPDGQDILDRQKRISPLISRHDPSSAASDLSDLSGKVRGNPSRYNDSLFFNMTLKFH